MYLRMPNLVSVYHPLWAINSKSFEFKDLSILSADWSGVLGVYCENLLSELVFPFDI